jgi:O-antigen ligase
MAFSTSQYQWQVNLLNIWLMVAFATILLPYFTIGSSVAIIILLAFTLIFKLLGNSLIQFKPSFGACLLGVFYAYQVMDNVLLSATVPGFYETEKRLALLAIPLAFSFIPIKKHTFHWSWVLLAFIGLQLMVLVDIEAVFKHKFVEQADYMYWGEALVFSWKVHRVYWSYIYLMIFCGLLFWPGNKYLLVRIVMAIVFALFIVQLLSKVFVALLFLLILIFLVQKLVRSRKNKPVFIAFAIVSLGIAYLLFNSDYPLYYFHQATNLEAFQDHTKAAEDNGFAIRYHIWRLAGQIFDINFATGVGVGNASNILLAAYEKDAFAEGIRLNLNAHNQFIQSALELGIFGLAFVCIIFATLFHSVNNGLHARYAFILLSFHFFLFESVLLSQKGLLMFTYLFCFYNYNYTIQTNGRKEADS